MATYHAICVIKAIWKGGEAIWKREIAPSLKRIA